MKSKAFTLIELLVVISIIGVISSVIFVSFSGSRDKARLAKAQNFDAQMSHALGAYAVGIWRFEEGTGIDIHDESGFGNDGTFHGNPTPVFPDGVYAGTTALEFDGSNDYVNIPSDLGNPDAMTIVFWFYVAQADKTRTQYFMDGRNNGNWWFLQSYSPSGTGNINFYNRVKVDPSDWTAGKWTHLALVVNSTASKIYIDGALKATGSGYNPNIGKNMRIGTRFTNSSYFRGQFDNVSIYNEALSSAQIQQHYAAGAITHGIAVNQ